jgi:hypothetical protein
MKEMQYNGNFSTLIEEPPYYLERSKKKKKKPVLIKSDGGLHKARAYAGCASSDGTQLNISIPDAVSTPLLQKQPSIISSRNECFSADRNLKVVRAS